MTTGKQWEEGRQGSWSFNAIGDQFDEHVRRHLPGYEQIQQLAVSAAMWNVYEGARVLDVGCATGQTLALLAGRSPHAFEGIGLDIEEKMVSQAAERFSECNNHGIGTRLGAVLADAATQVSPPCDVILALFSLQFIPTPARWSALTLIRRQLKPGGLFILAEKTLGASPRGVELHAGLYSDWKLQNGVAPEELVAKWSSLRGQLIPWDARRYESWALDADLGGDLIWCWGPFRAWAWWAPEEPLRD